MPSPNRNPQYPAAIAPTALALLLIVLAGCGPRQPGADGARNAETETASVAADPTATTDHDRSQQWLSAANAAFQAGRLTSPEGDNALAYLLAVIEREPDHRGAFELLVDLTPMVASAIEAQIAAGEMEQAASALTLLGRASPDSLIVQSLQRKLADARLRARAQPGPGAAAPVGTDVVAAPEPAPAVVLATIPADRPAERALAVSWTAPQATPDATVMTAPATTGNATNGATAIANAPARPAARPQRDDPAPPMPSAALLAATSEPVAISKPPPQYPDAARKRRTEGWVDLQFTVNADGGVDAVEVLSAQPNGVFERSAERAVQRWRFKPAERDGKAVPARVRTRVGFRLG